MTAKVCPHYVPVRIQERGGRDQWRGAVWKEERRVQHWDYVSEEFLIVQKIITNVSSVKRGLTLCKYIYP